MLTCQKIVIFITFWLSWTACSSNHTPNRDATCTNLTYVLLHEVSLFIIFLVCIFQHSYLLQRDCISPYSVRIRENTDQKNSETLFTQCTSLLKLFGLPLVLLGGQILQTLKRNTLVHHVSKYDISKAFHNFQTGWNIKNRIIGN